jgi:O-antigen/teichoic acid export membrane protein
MAADARNRSIRSAIWTSFLSKGGNALLQLLALPVAMRVMGWEEFGLYASVAGLLLTVQLFEIGLGPALTHGLSKAVAEGDRDRERALSATAFFLLLGLAGAAFVVMAEVIIELPVAYLFGEKFMPHEATLRPALWAGLVLFVLMLVLNHTERVREGYLEARYNNLWGAAGNVIAAATVGIGIWFVPTVSFLLLAVFGSSLLVKLGNTIQLWRTRPWLVPSWQWVRGGLARWMLTDSVAYVVFAVVVNLVEFNIVQNLYGRLAGPVGVTGYAVLTTITMACLGFVLMITTPTWPAMVDAKARGDLAWIRWAARRLWMYAAGFALCAGLGLIAFGPWLLPVWVGPKAAELDRGVLVCYVLYFLAYVWRHANHMLLVGLGKVRILALVQIIESSLLLGAAWLGMNHGGLSEMLLAMAATIALVTGWCLPWLFHRDLRSAEQKRPVVPPGVVPEVGRA